MTVTYATFDDFTAVHSLRGVERTEIDNYFLPQGALRVNEALGGYFTTPFSSNNQTARDLNIKYSFLEVQLRARSGGAEDIRIQSDINNRITGIRCGNLPMILDSGESIFCNAVQFDSWSSTQEYIPVFNMLDATDQEIDPDQIQDRKDEQI